MSLSAIDGDDRAQQLITLTERLTARLTAETNALEARRPQTMAAGAEETLRLANLYRHESLRIRQDPSLLNGAKAALRKQLIQVTVAFQAVLARHGRAVTAAKILTEGLVQAIALEVAAQRSRAAGYGPSALAALGDASAITLNRRA
jgi:hypothetical protein